MSPEALSELIFNIANNLVNEGKAGTLTTDLIPPQAKFAVMRPKDRAHGDWASNAAMQLAKKAGMKPHDFAELFAAELANADGIKSVEVAGPGFINIVLDSASAAAVVDTVLNEGTNYGKNDHLSGKTLNLEFVSANPTGPIHIGGTRWAAVGDSMARVLEANGAKVVREYYFNDHGEQINRFAKSLVAAAHGEETPIDGYKGAYIDEIARRVIDEANADGIAILDLPRVDGGADNDGNPLGEGDSEQREEFRKRAVPMMFDEIRKSMKDFRVNFDVWFHENSLYSDGEVDKAIADLRERGDIYEKDGATWFESTKHGDDKDRVIIKSDGNYAYFAADIAYYRNKRHRDNDPADIAIYMLGADHHGYIGRMMAMCAAFGDEPGENMQILIGQLVNVLKDGKAVRMSKRAGNVVTIDDLTDAIGVDASRYSLARTDYNSPGRYRPEPARFAFQRESGVLRAVRARPLLQCGPQRSRRKHHLRGCRRESARHRRRRRSACCARPVAGPAARSRRPARPASCGPLLGRSCSHLPQVVQRGTRGAYGTHRSGSSRRTGRSSAHCQGSGTGSCGCTFEAQ